MYKSRRSSLYYILNYSFNPFYVPNIIHSNLILNIYSSRSVKMRYYVSQSYKTAGDIW
jgi:hypothetical protein